MMNNEPKPWAHEALYIPNVKIRHRKIGRIVYVVATIRCRQCGGAFGPFADLWTGDRVCVFCAGDAAGKVDAA